MRARGFEPEFPPEALAQAATQSEPPRSTGVPTRDLRSLLWCSIDNDDSRDLDQVSVAEGMSNGAVRVLIAIADVDAVVPKGSPVDRHAEANATSVYTPAMIFPMLPERFSTDVSSLNENTDRLAVVIEVIVAADGTLAGSDVFGALVRNHAKLAYNAVDAWLIGQGPLPPAAAAIDGLDLQLKTQDGVAQALELVRHRHGALQFQTMDVRPVFDGDTISGLRAETPNRAKVLIENLMIAANGVVAAISRRPRLSLHSPCGARAGTLGAHRRPGVGDRRSSAAEG